MRAATSQDRSDARENPGGGRGRPRLIAYVGPFGFPQGGAAARRILGNARSLTETGFHVAIGSGQEPAAVPHGYSPPDGIDVHSLGERTAEHVWRPLRRMRYGLMGGRTVAWLDSLSPRPAAVILYSGYSPYLLRLLPWCRRRGVPLVFDAVEWYDAGSRLAGLLSPYQWNIELAMRWLSTRVDATISISSHLASHYRAAGCPTVVVPPTLDTSALPPRLAATRAGPLRVCYVGSPGNKDLLDRLVEAVLAVDRSGTRLQLHVAGLPRDELGRYPALMRHGGGEFPPALVCHGSVSHDEAVHIVREADFSLLLRRPERYAQAGFPTKVVESLALGTPVIANLTSDMDRHITDGHTGIVCPDERAETMAGALERALLMTEHELTQMRKNARLHAEAHFDYRRHSATLASLLRSVGVAAQQAIWNHNLEQEN